MARSDFERLGDLVNEVIAGHAHPEAKRQLALQKVWEAAVGKDIARNARPVALKRGRLIVSTSSPAWAHTLQVMEREIVARLAPAVLVERISCRAAGWTQAEAPVSEEISGPEEEISSKELPGVLPEAEAVGAQACDPELGRRIARAMSAWLRRRRADSRRRSRP